jgi:hypothetical protein
MGGHNLGGNGGGQVAVHDGGSVVADHRSGGYVLGMSGVGVALDGSGHSDGCAVVGHDWGGHMGLDYGGGKRCSGHSGGNNSLGFVDEDGCGILGLNSGLIGLDVGSEAGGIGHIVDDSDASVSVPESV